MVLACQVDQKLQAKPVKPLDGKVELNGSAKADRIPE
jgi:hypothetical protein